MVLTFDDTGDLRMLKCSVR